MVAALLWFASPNEALDQAQIEQRARSLGMRYRDEFVLYERELRAEAAKGTPEPVPPPTEAPRAASEEGVEVVLPAGSNLAQAARILAQAGVVEQEEVFLHLAQEQGLSRKLVAGSYHLERSMAPEAVLKIISGGGPK